MSSAPTLVLQFDAMSAAAPNGTTLGDVLERRFESSAALGAFEIEVHA